MLPAQSSQIDRHRVGSNALIHAYYRFRDLRIIEVADEFLSSHGVNIDWDDRHTL